MERFPTVEKLANGQEELLKYWEGLGYYNRIRNMNKAAIQVCNEFDGRMPVSYDALITLPGIGPYTAGAIASIAGGEKVPAVDGNVLRVITRLNGDFSNISEQRTVQKIRKELFACMPEEPGRFNQALMEFGAMVCLPNGEPKCEECLWQTDCFAMETATKVPDKFARAGFHATKSFYVNAPRGYIARGALFILPNQLSQKISF